ncbi:hypothetical protein JTB14_028317 [Gonioctena quinquepunctata]|nr:hypothetical protein JTB14_028317 [Gonioctena quinquepunctata]
MDFNKYIRAHQRYINQMKIDIYRVNIEKGMDNPEEVYDYKQVVGTFDKVCSFKYHRFWMIGDNYDTYCYRYLKNDFIQKANRTKDEYSKTKLENIMRQEFMRRKQILYRTLSWMIDIIDGKTKNCMNKSEEYHREYKVQYDLLKESLPEQWDNFREKFPDIKGYEKFERGPINYGKYENYETEKR